MAGGLGAVVLGIAIAEDGAGGSDATDAVGDELVLPVGSGAAGMAKPPGGAIAGLVGAGAELEGTGAPSGGMAKPPARLGGVDGAELGCGATLVGTAGGVAAVVALAVCVAAGALEAGACPGKG